MCVDATETYNLCIFKFLSLYCVYGWFFKFKFSPFFDSLLLYLHSFLSSPSFITCLTHQVSLWATKKVFFKNIFHFHFEKLIFDFLAWRCCRIIEDHISNSSCFSYARLDILVSAKNMTIPCHSLLINISVKLECFIKKFFVIVEGFWKKYLHFI